MIQPISVTYESTSSVYTANQWLRHLDSQPLIAWDLEIAVKYTSEELEEFRKEIEEIEARLAADNYN